MKSRVMHVEIFGQQYAVRGELDPQYVHELAAYLDDKMRLAAREIASADAVRIAVIAALNIADELFAARSTADGVERRVLQRTADLERLVDAVLDGAKARAVNE